MDVLLWAMVRIVQPERAGGFPAPLTVSARIFDERSPICGGTLASKNLRKHGKVDVPTFQ
jgi:hypothetical protein